MFEQRIDGRFTAAKCLEGLGGRAGAPYRKDFVQETSTSFWAKGVARTVGLDNGALFKGRIGVGGQHLGPFVAVIAGAVAPREQMREVMRKAVPRGREEDGHFLAYLVKGLEHFFDRQPGIMLVDTHVKQSKF